MEQRSDFTIIYIMGRGYSGSTVLDLILGNHEKIQSVGEFSSGFLRRSEHCSCGSLIDNCEFWGNVRERFQQLYPDTSLDDYCKMMFYMDRFYRIPQLKTQLGLPSWFESQYNPMTYDLYSLIFQQSGQPYIVDSSKEIGRAYYMLTRFPAKVKIIHLVRDGQGVIWSRLRRLRAGQKFRFLRRHFNLKWHWPLAVLETFSWNIANVIGILLRLSHKDQVLQVRYEDICNDPAQELTRIGEFIELDMTELVDRVEKGEPLNISHTIGGNHMRFAKPGAFTLKPDYTWRERLPMKYKLSFLLLAFPLAFYYGYL